MQIQKKKFRILKQKKKDRRLILLFKYWEKDRNLVSHPNFYLKSKKKKKSHIIGQMHKLQIGMNINYDNKL